MALITNTTRLRGRPFQRGVSGNANGRPLGSRNKATLRIEALLDATGEALVIKLIDCALKGDMVAMRLCLKIMFPPGRKRGVEIALPQLDSVGDCMKAHAMIIDKVGSGELTIDEATALSELVETHSHILDQAELEARL